MLRRNISRNPDIQRLQERVRIQNSLPHRIRESWPTVVVGSVLLLSGMLVIVWNEARAVETSKALEESISSVTEIFPDTLTDDAVKDKPIYITGAIAVREPLTEVDYGISVSAVKLKRRVQMYQWVEEESSNVNVDGDLIDSRYYYYTDWKDKLIDSTFFATSVGHWNPKEFPIKSQTQINDNVKIGNFDLGLELKKKFTSYVEITSDERPERKDIKLHSGLYYHAQDIWNPEVGDLRIQFSYAGHHGQAVTIVGKLDHFNTIIPYKTNLGVSILLLRLGTVSVEDIFAQEHAHNQFLSWLYRGGAWFLLYLGCVCLKNILSTVLNQSRILRDLLPTAQSSMKMTVSMSLFLIVTALAWVLYRPALGLSLVAAMILILFVTKSISDLQSSPDEYERL